MSGPENSRTKNGSGTLRIGTVHIRTVQYGTKLRSRSSYAHGRTAVRLVLYGRTVLGGTAVQTYKEVSPRRDKTMGGAQRGMRQAGLFLILIAVAGKLALLNLKGARPLELVERGSLLPGAAKGQARLGGRKEGGAGTEEGEGKAWKRSKGERLRDTLRALQAVSSRAKFHIHVLLL